MLRITFSFIDLGCGDPVHDHLIDIFQRHLHACHSFDRSQTVIDPVLIVVLVASLMMQPRSDKNNAVVEMTLPEDNTQIFASKYETVLPSKEALQKLLEEQMADENGGEDDETTI